MFSTTYLQSFFYLIQTHAISSQRSQILRRTDTSCLCNIGTRSKPCDISWAFWVYLYQTIQYKLFQELRIHLSANSYLWSCCNIVKAMFKSTFLSLIVTPWCKYTYSKNNVKFLKSTSSEISLKAKFAFWLKFILFVLQNWLLCYFWSRTDQLKFCPGIQHDDACNLFHTHAATYPCSYLYVYFSPECTVKTNNNQRKRFSCFNWLGV